MAPPPQKKTPKTKTKQNMQSAVEMVSKNHNLIPFSKKIPGTVAASLNINHPFFLGDQTFFNLN